MLPSMLIPFASFLGFLWFLVYWIFGGVFFALVAILRLGRVRKVRFSCLFSVWTLFCGVGAALFGIKLGEESIQTCYLLAQTRAETITAFFGCGFAGVFSLFMLGAVAVILGGFAILSLSKNKSKAWIVFDKEDDEEKEEGFQVEGEGFFR
ncbi:hypothetical protein A2239_01980 [Candidatus Uhrbacteria bacterium RIFOXYA2_FULL_40_9]|nr:MAG: hypothetical protein UT94_C0011G0016 [Candidatus Uhrbacteria bacterium GW2011_GWF2_40_263]OGL94433.1 MAG: hypothetical protein A2239_01980 [Candidatus Uhrbacteria bacterium RIFOXYA2_FULL_40_9]OGL96679.1 MAG: hypothetical protein A2332_05150 [Candidatus Uhrbacteria bacterium RIFOXYB2_FULL_41_18]HBK34706.1 hypothetical protein [Candidatus Uhrbacteria bacterium]HCB56000.1 hypothetical protein [Candidatus Uhrbacteria bacterium]